MPMKDPFNRYYRTLLKPTVKLSKLDCKRADEIHGPQVMADIWDSIWRAKLVIADVTYKNPNVNYELGLCHALGVPTVIITQHRKHVPFDYLHHQYILYQPGKRGWMQKLRKELVESIKVAMDGSSNRERMLVWPTGVTIGRRSPRPDPPTLPLKRSALLDFPRVPFRASQNADFIGEKIPRKSIGFNLRITLPDQVYWRCGFVLAPEDYIHDGLVDIDITQYFLFHISQGRPTTPTGPPQRTDLSCQAYHLKGSLMLKPLNSQSPVELRVRFTSPRRNLRINLRDEIILERELDPSCFRNLYILAWADHYPPVRVPIDFELL